MAWLRRHAWWGLLALGVIFVMFGVTDMASGAAADVAIPQGLTGKTIHELEAESPDAYGLFDFMTRVNGWGLVLLGVLLTLIVLIPYRRGERWAWWALWLLPIGFVGSAGLYLVTGLAPDQPPPPPLAGAPILTALCAAILLVTRPGAETDVRR